MDKISKNISQYIELVYSEKSELNSIQDLEERKKTACEKAKLDYADPDIQRMLHIKDKQVNDKIFAFCERQCPNEFYLLISKQHLFWEQQQILMEPLKKVLEDGKTQEVDDEQMLKRINLKNTISEKSETLLESINLLRSKIFTGEQEHKMAEEKIRALSLEQRLQKAKAKT